MPGHPSNLRTKNTYSCEPLVTAQPHTLKVLEHAQNQALKLITGAVKTTAIDAMIFITGNQLVQELIKERQFC